MIFICTDQDLYCDFAGSLCAANEQTDEKALQQNFKSNECLSSCTEMEIFLIGFAYIIHIFYALHEM